MPRRLFLLLALLSILLVPASPLVRAGEKPTTPVLSPADIDASMGVDWYGLYLQGKKIGWLKSSRARDQASGEFVEAMHMKMKLTSFGQRIEVDFQQNVRFASTPPYRMITGEQIQNDGNSKKTTLAVNREKKCDVIANVGGQQTKKTMDVLDYTLPDSLALDTWLQRIPKQGATLTYKDLDLDEAKLDEATSTLLTEKTSLVNGVEVKFFEVKTRSTRNPVDMLGRHDAKGKMLSGNFAIFEVRAEPEEQAKNTQYSQDLFVLGMVKVDRGLGSSRRVQGLVLEVLGEEAKMLSSGPRQSIMAKTPKSHLLKLGKRYGTPAKASAEDIRDNVKETLDYPITNARVQALAKEAVGDAETDVEKVKRLVNFVHKFVRPNLTAALPNIPDLLEKKKGDCKSYALLFNTLARAAGVPSREVSGLLYVGDDSKAFGGHAWNEVILDGQWVPVDASMGETEVNATHICFGDDTQSIANLLGTMGKLSFRVIEIERGE